MPLKITVNLIKKAMREAGWASKRFLIDGFPRNEDNYCGWQKVIGDKANFRKVLFFECDEDTLVKRILNRAQEAGKDKRNDDNVETCRKRFA